MDNTYSPEPMLEMFLFETSQLIEQMDQAIIIGEQSSGYTPALINEILRAMHTIKGSAAMMMYSDIAKLAHSLEDVLYFLREQSPQDVDYSELTDLVLEGSDFIKIELHKLRNAEEADGNALEIIQRVEVFLNTLKENNLPVSTTTKETILEQMRFEDNGDNPTESTSPAYHAVIAFDEDCSMENIRAFSIVHQLKELAHVCWYSPEDIVENENSAEEIRKNGFRIWFRSTVNDEELHQYFMRTAYLKSLELVALNEEEWSVAVELREEKTGEAPPVSTQIVGDAVAEVKTAGKDGRVSAQQSIISVNVSKLDSLMDLVGELVISEAMVTQNPEIRELQLDSFLKAARQLRKITSEIQDMVMSIRMVPLATTFQKMHRIVRDMCKRLEKEVQLNIVGEETEVDKNIIERISDPLMHVIRNSIDHGLESPAERMDNGKDRMGTITLEAKNAGSDVLIVIRDDGRGLNKERILDRARNNNLVHKPEQEMTDKEIYSLIFLPGFSTKETVSEFSGRGVGMDVVVRNLEAVGGTVWVESEPGSGTTVYFKIPLTLAIIDGMNIRVGSSSYTIPITAIKESFRTTEREIIHDPNGYEMLMVRGQCYPILRLHERFSVKNAVTQASEGIMVMVESESRTYCLFADELIGEQQVVVKALPAYIRAFKKISGLTGCTLLGDGSISLILDVESLL